MQKKEINKRIEKARYYKNKVKEISNDLFKEYKSGKISYSEYFFRLSKFLKGKTEEQWYSYYDSYSKNLENKLDKPKEESKFNKLLLILLILFFSIGIFFFYPVQTGLFENRTSLISQIDSWFDKGENLLITGFATYEDNGSLDNATESFIILAPGSPYFTNHLNNQTAPKYNENINLSIDINDDDADIDFVIFSTNDSDDSWENYTFNLGATGLHQNWTILNVQTTKNKRGFYCWFANDSASNVNRSKNGTDPYYFFRVQNSAPTVNIETTFANTTNNHSMVVWANFSDADGPSDTDGVGACKFFVLNRTERWSTESSDPTNGNCSTLLDNVIDNYVVNEELNVTIQVYDGDDYVNSTGKNNTLVNHLPTLSTNPKINDTTPNVDVWLNCTIGAYSDTDSDPKNKDYWRWYLSDIIISNQNNYTLNLSAISESPNNTIFCSQRVYDSYDNSTWYNSSLATTTLFGEDIIKKGADSTKKISMNIVLDILTPAPISIYGEDTITVPITIKNNGKYNLNNINLKAIPTTPDLTAIFANPIIPSLLIGEEFKTDLIITSSSTPGSYEIKIIAEVASPKFTDTTRLIIDIVERGLLNQTIIVTRLEFAKDLFEENPECTNLDYLLTEANKALENKNYERARQLTEAAVRKCRDLVSPIVVKEEVKPINYRLIIITTIIIISLILVTLITYKLIKPK